MNSMAAVFIVLGFDEATALSGFSTLTEQCCPEYFGPDLKGYVRDVAVLGVLVRKILPVEISQRLDNLGVSLNLLAADHFLALGSHSWPLGAVVRLWDLAFLDGSPAIFAAFLALLQLYLPEDRSSSQRCADTSESVKDFLNAVAHGIAEDLDLILEKTRELIPMIPGSMLKHLRYIFSEAEADAVGVNVWL
jgi:hypothetical protein